jgi:N-acetylglutamate synthase-like GNAT family acetyltransferase
MVTERGGIAVLTAPDDLEGLQYFSRLRRHPGFSIEDIAAMNRQDCAALFTSSVHGFCQRSAGITEAVCAVVPSSFESDWFGLRMGRLHSVARATTDSGVLADLVEATLREARAAGIRHVSADVDIDDYRLLNVLAGHGFEILDLKRTYFTNRLHEDSSYTRALSRVRDYHVSDAAAVEAILAEATFETRFTRDCHLDKGRADAFYRHWFQDLIGRCGLSSHVVVYEKLGQVVGCGGIGEVDFRRYGLDVRLRTGSLYACRSDGVGGYGPVLYRLTRDALRTHGLVETTVSLNNAVAARVVEGVRPNRSVTAYALRRFLD